MTLNEDGDWEEEEEEGKEKYELERDAWGEAVNVDSVTKSGLQCTDFLALPGDGALRSFGPCDSDPDPFAAASAAESPMGTWDSCCVSGFGGSIRRRVKARIWTA